MRKLFAVAALAAGTLGLGVVGAHADQLPGGVEGCVATSPGANAPVGSLYNGGCSFVATRTGGFVAAAQSYTVVVYNNNSATKVEVGRYTGSGGGCSLAAYVPGNLVTVTVSNGEVAAGNPIPSATDGSIPSNGDSCKR
ncbi:MAG: hypothetical protein QOK43_606 [Acidimicrobiaceae bacterium]|nr:hypothetical protein [Acidimicrobiaceae bacterium]MDQ1446244.1 hypothetical protein [Acidimicrobiaceae bacterium]